MFLCITYCPQTLRDFYKQLIFVFFVADDNGKHAYMKKNKKIVIMNRSGWCVYVG